MAASCLAGSAAFTGQEGTISPEVDTAVTVTEPKSVTLAAGEPGTNADDADTGNKQYHELEPAKIVAGEADDGSESRSFDVNQNMSVHVDQNVASAGCEDESARVTTCATRRSRRFIRDEHVPLKKRKRMIACHLEEEEDYILPAHVQVQADKEASGGRRLRSHRASAPLTGPESMTATPDTESAGICLVQLAKTEPKSEPSSEGDEAEAPIDPPPLVISSPPRRKRGRPRKNVPKRLVLPVPRQSARPEADSAAAPARAGTGRARRGRKSAAPSRRPSPARSETPPPPPAENGDGEQSATDAAPASPPAQPFCPPTEHFTLTCHNLPPGSPVTLTDRQLTVDLPTRRLFPCPHCVSLTARPTAGTREHHTHSSTRELTPRCRLRVQVKPGANAQMRTCKLDDYDVREPKEFVSSRVWLGRGRRRGGRRGGLSGGRGGAQSTGARELECGICSKQMLSVSRLKKHQLVHTDERPYHCDKCPKSFKSVHVLNAHQLTHINYRPFHCSICNQTFAKKWTLRGHMATHERSDGTDDLVCHQCGCAFQDRSTYDSHVKIHTGERKWECKVCHRGFAKKLKLRKHMVVHSSAMLHKCHLCDREFRWKEKLVKHVMLHTGERPFKCTEPRCVKSFRAHSDLNVHIRNVHKKQPKKLNYPIVKSEPKPNHCELLLMRVNEMEGIPPCDLCTRHFTSKAEYLNHIIPAHRDQEAYVCHPCKRVFNDKRIYEEHVDERHKRGEIMWRCQLCPKIFNKRSLFEGHKTLHATKFQCKICFRFASDEKRLQVHIMQHRYTDIDNSSHACTICSRQFKLRFSLKNHMFKMHSIDLPSLRKPPMRKFECSICHARFVRPTPAYNHMVRVHNIRPEPEVQDMFDLTALSVDNPEPVNYEVDADDPSVVAALQNNIRMKVEAMAAQGMWDASEADGSTYLGGSAAARKRSQPPREARAPVQGDSPSALAPEEQGSVPDPAQQCLTVPQSCGSEVEAASRYTEVTVPQPMDLCVPQLGAAASPTGCLAVPQPFIPSVEECQPHQTGGFPPQLCMPSGDHCPSHKTTPFPPAGSSQFQQPGSSQFQQPGSSQFRQPGSSQFRQPGSGHFRQPRSGQFRQPALAPLTPERIMPEREDHSMRTLLRLSPGKRGQLVRVSSPPLDTSQHQQQQHLQQQHQQQIIVIQQGGDDEIDLSRVLGASEQPTDAQTLTMNADGFLVDDQGQPVSLMVEPGGAATRLLDYLRAPQTVPNSTA